MITLNFLCDAPKCGSEQGFLCGASESVEVELPLRWDRLPAGWRSDDDGRIYCPRPACKAARREAMHDVPELAGDTRDSL